VKNVKSHSRQYLRVADN